MDNDVMNREFLHTLSFTVVAFYVVLSGLASADEPTARSIELDGYPVIVHKKGSSPYLTVHAKICEGMLAFLVEPLELPPRYDYVPLSAIDKFSVYANIDDALADYEQSEEIKERARERFRLRWKSIEIFDAVPAGK